MGFSRLKHSEAALSPLAGFAWGGWVTGGTARYSAMAMSHDDLVAAMVPVCLDMAKTDPQREAKHATIRAATIYQRRDARMEAGWAVRYLGVELEDALSIAERIDI